MRDPRSLLASIAASSVLVGAAAFALLSASAIVAFHGWPVGGGAAGSSLALPAVPDQAVQAPARILVPTTASSRDRRAVVRRAPAALRRRRAGAAPSVVRRRSSRRVVRAPSPATPDTSAPQPAPARSPAPATPADQVAGTAAAAPAQASDAVAGSSPAPELAAGDPR
ncbi:MAG: hypothetical protein ABI950_01210 [Solirubrobacteraceae bacterium]